MLGENHIITSEDQLVKILPSLMGMKIAMNPHLPAGTVYMFGSKQAVLSHDMFNAVARITTA